MTLTLVEHDALEPALYSALAAVLVRARGGALMHLPASFDTRAYADAAQHVAVAGALVASGLIWLERLTGIDVTAAAGVDAILAGAATGNVVVPYHPAVRSREIVDAMEQRAGQSGIAVERLRVLHDRGVFELRDAETGAPLDVAGRWTRDRFGRFSPVDRQSREGAAAENTMPLRIGLVGTETEHRDVYPAALASLADAAGAENVALDVVFIPPIDLREQDVDGILGAVAGVLLPGGSDMINVPGQIKVAHGALRTRTPAVGLCLGMQSMTTAVVQKALGSTQASLAEAAPDAPIKTFTMMAERGLMPYRLGEMTTVTKPGSRTAAILGAESKIRCNHRFHFNPELIPVAAKAGLHVTARDVTGEVTDAVELDGHPFYFGMQGHPELSSRDGAAHPLLRAFVRACAERADQRDR